jgi:hypothetical protein
MPAFAALAVCAPGCWKVAPEASPPPASTPKATAVVQAPAAENPVYLSYRTRFNMGLAVPKQQFAGVDVLLLSADGSRLAVSQYTGGELLRPSNKAVVQVWEVAGEPRLVKQFDGRLIAFAPDGKRLLMQVPHKNPQLVDVDGDKVLGELEPGSEVAWFPTPDVVVAPKRTGSFGSKEPILVREFDAATGERTAMYEVTKDHGAYFATSAPGGKYLFLYQEQTKKVQVVGLDRKEVVREIAPGDAKFFRGNTFTASPDGKWVGDLPGSKLVHVFDAATGAQAADGRDLALGDRSAFVPGRDLFLFGGNTVKNGMYPDAVVEVLAYDVKKKRVVAVFGGNVIDEHHLSSVLVPAASADGRVLAVGNSARDVTLWDLTQLK